MREVVIVLDGTTIANAEQFHQQLADRLAFPSWYGANLDALWDMLEGWIELPVTIIYNSAIPHMEPPEVKTILSLLEEAAETIDGFGFTKSS